MHDPIAERWETQNESGRRFFGKGDLARAEQAFVAAIREAEQLGAGDLRLATSLANLAQLKLRQRDYDEAERLFLRSLQIREATLGHDHASLVQTINGLATVHYARGETDAAEPLFLRALSITERRLGPQHPDIVTSLNSLARIAFKRSDYAAAGPLLERLLTVKETTLGPDHAEAAPILSSLVKVRVAEGALDEAERLARRVVAIRENEQPRGDLIVATAMESLADVLARTGRKDEEAAVRAQAERLRLHPAATAGLLPLTKRFTPDESVQANATPPQPKSSVAPPAPPVDSDSLVLYLPDEPPAHTPASSAPAAPSPVSPMPRIAMDAPGDIVVPHRKTPAAAPPPMRISPPGSAPASLTVDAGAEIAPMPAPPPPRVELPPPPRRPPPRRVSVERPVRREPLEPRREMSAPRPSRRPGRKLVVAMMLLATTGVAAATIGRGGVIESRGVAGESPRDVVVPERPPVSLPAPVVDRRALDSIAAMVRDSVAMLIGKANDSAAAARHRLGDASTPDPRQAPPDAALPVMDLRALRVDVPANHDADAARVKARLDSTTRRTVEPSFQSKAAPSPQP